MRSRRPAGALFLAMWAAVLLRSAAALGADLESAEAIEQCARDNLPRTSSVQTVVFRSTDRMQSVSESRAQIHWKKGDDGRSKLLMRFAKPLELRGAGVLLLENSDRSPDTLLYLPEIRKVRNVSSRAAASSVFGTDFSYEDFQRLMGMSVTADKVRQEDSEVDGQAVYVVAATPAPGSDSAYERVVTFVDKQTCVPLVTESYEPGGRLRKRVTADRARVTEENGLWIARSQTIRDLRDDTSTEFIVEEIDVEAEIPRKMFSARELEAGAR